MRSSGFWLVSVIKAVRILQLARLKRRSVTRRTTSSSSKTWVSTSQSDSFKIISRIMISRWHVPLLGYRVMSLLCNVCVVYSSAAGYRGAAGETGVVRVLLYSGSADGRSPVRSRHSAQLPRFWGSSPHHCLLHLKNKERGNGEFYSFITVQKLLK